MYHTTNQAAKMLGVHPSRLYRAIEAGKVKAANTVDGRALWTPEMVEAARAYFARVESIRKEMVC